MWHIKIIKEKVLRRIFDRCRENETENTHGDKLKKSFYFSLFINRVIALRSTS
jgi:hypothetical protein